MRGTYYTRRLCLTLDNFVDGARYTFVTFSTRFLLIYRMIEFHLILPVVIQIDVVEDVDVPPVNVP